MSTFVTFGKHMINMSHVLHISKHILPLNLPKQSSYFKIAFINPHLHNNIIFYSNSDPEEYTHINTFFEQHMCKTYTPDL